MTTTHTDDARRFSPAAERNSAPILEVLREALPEAGLVLEIASGTGQHAATFAPALPALTWQPTDGDADNLASIRAWAGDVGADNLRAPLHLDVHAAAWPVKEAAAMFCANMVHIAPWSACEALMDGAARVLAPGGALLLYGPFLIDGAHTAPSNVAFDQSLRARDVRWGVRDLGEVTEAAAARGLVYERRWEMPANNFTVAFRKPAE